MCKLYNYCPWFPVWLFSRQSISLMNILNRYCLTHRFVTHQLHVGRCFPLDSYSSSIQCNRIQFWREYYSCLFSRESNSSNLLLRVLMVFFFSSFISRSLSRLFCSYSWNFSLKSDSHLPKKILFIGFNESLSKMIKNAFYFILKALFVSRYLNFCLDFLVM